MLKKLLICALTVLACSNALADNWVFRGTPNAWAQTTPMRVVSPTQLTICQNFVAGDANGGPRFKIDNITKGSWVEAYPASDYVVSANSSYNITFNPGTHVITTVKRTTACPATVTVDVDRSLFVRDEIILTFTNSSGAPEFGLWKVFEQLAQQLNAANPARSTTSTELFSLLWDTQNPSPGVLPIGPKCTGTLNGFEQLCRPSEGKQAQNPFDYLFNGYKPIALVNRFDLRDTVSFSNCGQARIIFALVNDLSGRSLINFEALLPNPQPGVAAGCKPISDFWKNLSLDSNTMSRSFKLRDFFFSGIPAQNIRPVIDIRNFADATGQIRTNQFMEFKPWLLKEFKIAVENGVSIIKPVSVKSNPTGFQFNDTRTEPLSIQFRTQFLNNMGTLLNPDINKFFLTVQDDRNNNGQSHSQSSTENAFLVHTNAGTGTFKNAIQSRATALGSTLTSNQIVNRATAMTCAGCHSPSEFSLNSLNNSIGPNQQWPNSLGFTHVEEFTTNGKFNISPALQNVFLPARKTDLEYFVNTQGAGAD